MMSVKVQKLPETVRTVPKEESEYRALSRLGVVALHPTSNTSTAKSNLPRRYYKLRIEDLVLGRIINFQS